MSAPAEIDTSCLVLQDVCTSAKGAKSIPLLYKDGSSVQWQPREALQVLWEPSAYQDPDATRVNISFATTPSLAKQLQAFDEWAVETLAKESARLFGAPLDMEEVRRRYQPAMRVYEKTGSTSLRCKLVLAGRGQVKCWDSFRNPRPMPQEWMNCAVTARITLKGFWCMGKELGPLFLLSHALVDESVAECPF